jgi:hypothetical protein
MAVLVVSKMVKTTKSSFCKLQGGCTMNAVEFAFRFDQVSLLYNNIRLQLALIEFIYERYGFSGIDVQPFKLVSEH